MFEEVASLRLNICERILLPDFEARQRSYSCLFQHPLLLDLEFNIYRDNINAYIAIWGYVYMDQCYSKKA